MIWQNVVFISAEVKLEPRTENFSESPYQDRSKTVEIQDIFDISGISVNTGKVSYSISGDKVILTVSEGVPSRVGPHTKAVTVLEENTYDDFPNLIPYDLDGYIGEISKVDSGYDSIKKLYWAKYFGNVTKAECNFYSYTVNFNYTLNVAPQLSLSSPKSGDFVKDKIDIKGFAKDENISDILDVNYAFDTYTSSTKGTAYISSLISDGKEQDIDNTIEIKHFKLNDGAHTLYMWAVDKRGVRSALVETSFTLDTIPPDAPTLTQDPTTPTNKTVDVTVSYPDDAAVKEIRINGASWGGFDSAAKDGKITVDENGIIEARAIDVAGNISDIGIIKVTNIDKIAPAKPVISQEPVNSIPTNGDVAITIAYPADAAEKLYKVGIDGAWIEYKDSFKLIENETVYAVCTDEAGNKSEEASIVVTNIDKIPPEAPILRADITIPTNQSVNVTVTYPADAAVKEIRINSSAWEKFDTKAKDGKIIMDQNGTVEARAIDAAGNISDIGRLVISNIDKTSPDTPILKPDTTKPTNKSVTVSVYYPGDPVTKEVKIGDDGWKPYDGKPIVVDKNTTIEARSTDDAGNYSPTGRLVVDNIDTTPSTAPVITTSADKTTESPIIATIKPGKDEESGVDRTEYCLAGATTSDWQEYENGSLITITKIGETKINARTVDNAGNVSPVTSKTVTINKSTNGDSNNNNDDRHTPPPQDKNSNDDNNNNKNTNQSYSPVPNITVVDLAVFLSSDKSKYAEGEIIKFAIEYKNKSAETASNVIVKAEIPAYTTVVDLAGGTAKGTAIEWKIAKLAANTSGKIEYKVSVNKLDKAEVSSSNTATVTSTYVTKTEDDSSKTIFLLYSNVNNYHARYIAGYEDNTFRPGNNVTRAEVAAMMYRVLGIDKVESLNRNYSDVKSTHWAYKCINSVTNAGLFMGYRDGSFHPDSYITRAEFATVLANYLKLKNVEHDKINFSDINNHWAKNFIEEIYRVKLIEGYIENGERLFKPDNNISRSEAVTIVNKMLFRGPLSGIRMPFKDVAENHWAYGQILESALDHHFTRAEDDSEIAAVEK